VGNAGAAGGATGAAGVGDADGEAAAPGAVTSTNVNRAGPPVVAMQPGHR
jgi:hypothetical protein